MAKKKSTTSDTSSGANQKMTDEQIAAQEAEIAQTAADKQAEADLEAMKVRADAAGVEYAGNIGIETLTERVEAKELANAEAASEAAAAPLEDGGLAGDGDQTVQDQIEADNANAPGIAPVHDEEGHELTGAEALAISNDY